MKQLLGPNNGAKWYEQPIFPLFERSEADVWVAASVSIENQQNGKSKMDQKELPGRREPTQNR